MSSPRVAPPRAAGVPAGVQCQKGAKPKPGHLKVIVLDHKGAPLPEAAVRVSVAADATPVGNSTGDRTGKKIFWCLDPVSHSVKAEKKDYEVVSGSATVISGTTVTVTLTLRPLLQNVQIVSIRYTTDNQEIRSKYDNWKDPSGGSENVCIADMKPEYHRGTIPIAPCP